MVIFRDGGTICSKDFVLPPCVGYIGYSTGSQHDESGAKTQNAFRTKENASC